MCQDLGEPVTLIRDDGQRIQDLRHQLSSHQWSSSYMSNVTFVCSQDETLMWNGLAYLGSLSTIFKPRSGEEQSFTVLLPDHSAQLLRKLLILISTGASIVRKQEVDAVKELAKDLGVSCLNATSSDI